MTSWRSEIRVLYRPLPKTPQYLVFCGVFSCQNALRQTARHDLTCVGYVKSCSSSYKRSPHQRRSLYQRRECPPKSWAVDAANARPESPCWWCYWGCRVTGDAGLLGMQGYWPHHETQIPSDHGDRHPRHWPPANSPAVDSSHQPREHCQQSFAMELVE